jgi:hypothetical protein
LTTAIQIPFRKEFHFAGKHDAAARIVKSSTSILMRLYFYPYI